MRLPSKPVWLLIGVHTLCLSVGFWFLCQLLLSSTEHQALKDSWSDLYSRSGPVAEVAGSLQVAQPATTAVEQLRSASLEMPNALQTGTLLVGQDWIVLDAVSVPTNHQWTAGQTLRWQADKSAQIAPRGPLQGKIELADGSNHAAVIYPARSQQSYVVVYDSRSYSSTWRGSVMSALPVAAGIAFLWTWVLSSVATYLLSARWSSEELHRKAQSEHEALRSAQDLLRTRDAVIFGLAKLAESRDPDTGHHLERISLYSTRLANALRSLPQFQRIVTPSFVRLLGISSVLHDIGKVGLEDNVLLKPGRLNPEERKRMQEHTLVAGDCLREIEQRLGASNFLQTAREIALYHHERWDGNGYPTGLAGEAIPLAARIVTIADVYDALSSKRVYKEAFPHEECVRLIREGAGTQFDPDLVRVFLTIESDFDAIAQRFKVVIAEQREAASTIRPDDLMTRQEESLLLDVVAGTKSHCETSSRSSSVA